MTQQSASSLKAGERVDFIPSNQLKIIQTDQAFALSTDTLALAAFSRVRRAPSQRVVDFCTGNGAIPLLLSSRTKGRLYGIELQADIADMAERSVALNGLTDRITIYQANIRQAGELFPINSVDVVTCNPPYFKDYPHSTKNSSSAKALARHELAMKLEDIFIQAQLILKGRGKLYLVHRPDRLTDLILTGHAHHFSLKRLCLVYPKEERPANMVLLEFLKEGQDQGLTVDPPLIIHEADGSYTPEARRMIYGQ